MLSREIIISTLANELRKYSFIDAMWEGGSAAFNRVDEWSDLNIYISGSGDPEDIFEKIEKFITQLSWIIDKYTVPQPSWHGHYQTFYRLNGLNKFQVVDCTVINSGHPARYMEPEIYGKYIVHFDKTGLFDLDHRLDNVLFEKMLDQRVREVERRFVFFQYLIEKEINRGNFIEAFEFYYRFTIEPLIELLRIKYSPFHYNFNTRHIYHDLPAEVVKQIEPLVFIRNRFSFQKMRVVAQILFYDTLECLKLTGVHH